MGVNWIEPLRVKYLQRHWLRYLRLQLYRELTGPFGDETWGRGDEACWRPDENAGEPERGPVRWRMLRRGRHSWYQEQDVPAVYPAQIAVFCDGCGAVAERDYLVHDSMSREQRHGVARAHLTRNEGWSCGLAGDSCPACVRGLMCRAAREGDPDGR